MKAVYITEFDSLDDLEIREISEPPRPESTQVKVRVKAAGLNRADLAQVAGLYPPPAGYSPNIPGLEFAGEIVEKGDSVTGWNVGDRVCGIVAGEAQAEFLITDASTLIAIPDSLGFVDAAAIPEAFITAHDAVFTQGELKSGDWVLIHAVGSGVGLAALQMANAAGANVIGTSRTADKLEKCKSLGLKHAIAASDANFSDQVLQFTDGRGVNVILDLVGASYFSENLRSLAVKGRLILVGLTGGRMAEIDLGLALQRKARIIGTTLRARTIVEKADATSAFISAMMSRIANGEIKPNVDRVFAAADAREAYEYLASNESFGKVILEF